MTTCDKCGRPVRQVAPVMSNDARFRVLDDITNMDRHLPRSALSDEQNAAIPWGEHPDDHQFQAWCLDCVASDEEAGPLAS